MKRFFLITALLITFISMIGAEVTSEQPDSANTAPASLTVLTNELQIQKLDSSVQAISEKLETLQENTRNSTIPWGNTHYTERILLPIVFIIFFFLGIVFIITIVFIYKHKEKKMRYELIRKTLEEGKEIPETIFKPSNEPKNMYAKGVINSFLGFGLGLFLWGTTGEFGIGCIGFTLTLVGIGQIIIHRSTHPSENKRSLIRMNRDKTTGETSIQVGGIQVKTKSNTDHNTPEE